MLRKINHYGKRPCLVQRQRMELEDGCICLGRTEGEEG